jgi:hypothetical protein
MRVLLVAEGASELSGALEALVRRLGLADAEINTDRVSNNKIHAHHGSGRGFLKRALRWMLHAQDTGHDALVFLIDEDGHSERQQEIADANDRTEAYIRRALGVAIKTFDAWMLADEKALSQVLCTHISRQRAPEAASHPKETCSQLFIDSGQSISASELYAEIAKVIDLEVLSERCPRGFGLFAGRVQNLQV